MGSGTRSILEGLQIGNSLGQPIAQGLLQRARLDFEKQQQEDNFKKQIMMLAAQNPELAENLNQQVAGATVDGQQSVKALPVGNESDKYLETPIGPLNVSGYKKSRDDDEMTKATRAFGFAKQLAEIKASQPLYGSPVQTDQGLMQFPTRGPNVGQGIPLTSGGTQTNKPQSTASFSDEKGNLWSRPTTGGAATPVTDGQGNPINIGIPNHIIQTDQGLVTVPSKGDAIPTSVQSPNGTALNKISVKTDQGSKLSTAEDKMLENAATSSVQLGRAQSIYDNLYSKNLAGPVMGKIQGQLSGYGLGNKEYTEGLAQIGPAVYQMARALHGVGVIRSQDLAMAEKFGERLDVSPEQFKGSLSGVAKQYLNQLEGFAQVKTGIMSEKQKQNLYTIAKNLEAVTGEDRPALDKMLGGAQGSSEQSSGGAESDLVNQLKQKHGLK